MKKNVGFIVLFLVIGLLLGCCGGYFYANSNQGVKEKEKKEVKESKVEVLDLSSKEIDVMNKLSIFGCNVLPYDYFLKKDKVSVNDISNKDAINFISSDNFSENKEIKKDESGAEYVEVDEDVILEKIQKRFGKNYKFEHKTYDDSLILLEYNKEKKQYKVTLPGFHCTGPTSTTIDRITKAYKVDNKLVITYRILFGESVMNPTGEYYAKYYKDYNNKELIPQKDLQYVPNHYEPSLYVADSDYLKNYSYGSEYEFTFEKQGNEYVFVSSELKK